MQIGEHQRQIIGRGMSFPGCISPTRGSTNTNEGFERINQSINVILSTRVGTRIGNRKFGSRIHLQLFEQNDYIVADLLKIYVFEALGEWEPRIRVREVDIRIDREDANKVELDIKYILKNTNLENNCVYMFTRNI